MSQAGTAQDAQAVDRSGVLGTVAELKRQFEAKPTETVARDFFMFCSVPERRRYFISSRDRALQGFVRTLLRDSDRAVQEWGIEAAVQVAQHGADGVGVLLDLGIDEDIREHLEGAEGSSPTLVAVATLVFWLRRNYAGPGPLPLGDFGGDVCTRLREIDATPGTEEAVRRAIGYAKATFEVETPNGQSPEPTPELLETELEALESLHSTSREMMQTPQEVTEQGEGRERQTSSTQ